MVVQRLLKCGKTFPRVYSENSAWFVEHNIDCEDNYLGLEMPACSFVSLTSLFQKLPLSKSPGPDCISAEQLVYADESLHFFLYELFDMCIVHGYAPNSSLNTTVVPICKNKNGNMSDTSNYRAVALATVVSKLLEHFILSSISPFLDPQTINLVLRLDIVGLLINVHFCWSTLLHTL